MFRIEGAQVLITGGNTGIGKATAAGLARLGAEVTITSRSRERGEEAVADLEASTGATFGLVELDLASFRSIRAAAGEILDRSPRLDVVVNNAGLCLFGGRVQTEDGFETMFGVNHVGHFLLTNLLLDRIKASAPARIVVLSSAGYQIPRHGLDWDDLQHERSYDAFYCYGHSKLANHYFGFELARRLDGAGVSVNVVHPGYVATELGRTRNEEKVKQAPTEGGARQGAPDLSHLPDPVTPESGAATSIYVASSPELEGVTGRYFADCHEEPVSEIGADAGAARRLWALTEELVASARG